MSTVKQRGKCECYPYSVVQMNDDALVIKHTAGGGYWYLS